MDSAVLKSYTEEDYYSLPEGIRSELVEGQFYDMASPSRIHQKILSELHITIGQYIRSKGDSCEVYPAPFAVRLFQDDKTVVEPDISVICDPDRLTDRGCDGAPDWIVEILSPSTSSHDCIRKLLLYRKAGVREYWIIDPDFREVIVYPFDKNQAEYETYSFEDTIRAGIYEDLSINLSSLNL